MQSDETSMLQEQFFSYVFHELRTPLTVIHSYAQILRAKLPDRPENQSLRTIADTIVTQGDEIVEMIEELLEAARLPLNRLNLDLVELNLGALLLGIIEQMPEISSKISYNPPEEDILILGDAPRLTRAFRALFQFSAKLSKNLHVEILPSFTNVQIALQLEVEATNTLFSNEEIERLFDLYRAIRPNNVNALPRAGSLDISLYVARGLLEHHGGKLDYNSTLPGFIITFPLPSE